MLVRVLTAQVAPDNVGEANIRMRPLLEELTAQHGLVYAKLARRLLPDGSEEMLLVEEWLTPADLFAWTGGRLNRVRLPEQTPSLFENLTITMYESLDRLPEELNLEVIDGGTHAGRGEAVGAGDAGDRTQDDRNAHAEAADMVLPASSRTVISRLESRGARPVTQ